MHNHEIIWRLTAIMRSWLENERGKFLSPTGIWIVVPWNQKPVCYTEYIDVVYFDQRLGAAHAKPLLKSSFSAFFVLKSWKKAKSKEFDAKLSKKMVFQSLHQNAGPRFYSEKNSFFLVFIDKFSLFLISISTKNMLIICDDVNIYTIIK